MFENPKLIKTIANQQRQIKEQQAQIDKLSSDMQAFKQILIADYDLNHFKDYAERKQIMAEQSDKNILYRLMHHILGYYYNHYDEHRFISYLDLQNLFAISIGLLRKKSPDRQFIKQLKTDYANNPCYFEKYGAYNKTLIRENYSSWSGTFILPDEDECITSNDFKLINPYLDNFYDVYIDKVRSIEFCGIVQQKLFDNDLKIGNKIPFKKLTLITQLVP